MAKKDNKKADDSNPEVLEQESSGSKLLTIIIITVIILIWLGIFGVLIKLDVGSFGSEVLYPVLKDVPVVNKILPTKETESTETASDKYTDIDKANARIKELEEQLKSAQSGGKSDEKKVKELEKEVDRLEKYEKQQAAFQERVKEFDKNVVYNEKAPDISEYQAYYESIDPDNAEKIYKQVVKDVQYNEKIKKQSTVYSKMEPVKAAGVLETMAGDLNLVASILDNMSESKSAEILANMEPETAAQITTKMTAK